MPSTLVSTEAAPVWLISAISIVAIVGLIILWLGKKIPRHGDWLVGLSLIGLIAAFFFEQNAPSGESVVNISYLRGWIWPRQEEGAISIGILKDSLGVALSTLAAFLAGAVIAVRGLLLNEKRTERFYAAAAFACAGVTISWLALTPWLAFLGVFFAVFGGFIALGSRSGVDAEASLASRFILERSWGLLFALFGAFALSSSGTTMVWMNIAREPGIAQSVSWLGAVLLAIGMLTQLQPFPFLSWLVMPSETLSVARSIFGQIFPGMAAFAVLTRFDGQFRAMSIFPVFGWVALISAVLTTFTGLFQNDWRKGIGTWISAGFSCAVAALCFTGPWAGTALLVSTAVAGTAFVMFGSNLDKIENEIEDKIEEKPSFPERVTWIKVGSISAAACGTGMVGFVSCAGMIRWIMNTGGDPSLSGVFAVTLFLMAFLLWKQVWLLAKQESRTSASWFSVLAPFLIIIGSLGVVWVGSLTGGAIPEQPDLLMTSLLDLFFPAQASLHQDNSFLTASWLHWGTLSFAILGAYWTSGRKQDLWESLDHKFPKTGSFFAQGYRMDPLMKRFLKVVVWMGSAIQSLIDRRIWGRWIPGSLSWGTYRIAQGASIADESITRWLNRGIRRGTDVPSKFLQLIQSGDVQWYLFFAIGTGIAILIHFLKTV